MTTANTTIQKKQYREEREVSIFYTHSRTTDPRRKNGSELGPVGVRVKVLTCGLSDLNALNALFAKLVDIVER